MPKDLQPHLVDKVARAAKQLLGKVQVVPFGSAITGSTTALSDVDILVVSPKIPKAAIDRAKLKTAIEELAGLPPVNPVEIHLATPGEASKSPIYSETLRYMKERRNL